MTANVADQREMGRRVPAVRSATALMIVGVVDKGQRALGFA